jgi:hypothetical protein
VARSGLRAQLTGERSETKVRDALLDAGLFCSKYEHDRGEDLLVELGGYNPSQTQPLIGLLQIRGHEAADDCSSLAEAVKRRMPLSQLRRWAAIPLPVVVIAVELYDNSPYFFAEVVDSLVNDVAPNGLGELDQDSVTVVLSKRQTLPDFLREQINSFYSSHLFPLESLASDAIARNHYEIIASNTPWVPSGAKVWMKHLRVLWKGPWRPAHFWATLNHIADDLQEREGGRHVPLLATMHVYRSLKDARDNNAIGHVSWLEDRHPNCEALREATGWPKAARWSRFRFNGKAALEQLPDTHAKEEISDEVYLRKAERMWRMLDAVYAEITNGMDRNRRLPEPRLSRLERKFRRYDDKWDKIGKPSPQFRVLDRMLDQYLFVLSSTFIWLRGKADVPEIRRQRWLQQELDLAAGHYRAFEAIAKVLRGG